MPSRGLKLKFFFLAIIFCGIFGLDMEASAAEYAGHNYTEVFYLCTGGDGSASKDGTCVHAWDPQQFYSGGDGYWGQTDSADNKVGPNDALVIMDEGGDITKLIRVMYSGLPGKPVTIRNAVDQQPILNPAHLVTEWSGPDENGVYSSAIPSIYGAVLFEDKLPLKKATTIACDDGYFYSADYSGSLYYKPTNGMLNGHVVAYISTSADPAILFNNIQYLTVTGLTFWDAATAISGQETPGGGTALNGITITNNKFYYCTGTFITEGDQDYSDITVTDNYLYRVGNGIELLFNGNGILNSTVTGAQLDRNTLVDAGTYDGTHRWSECWTNNGVTTGEYCGLGGQNLVNSAIRNNAVIGGFIFAVNIYANDNSIVRDNVMTHNYIEKDALGSFWMQSSDINAGFDNNVIAYNIINQCGTEARAVGQDFIANLIMQGTSSTRMNYFVNNTSFGGVENLSVWSKFSNPSVFWTFKNNIVSGNSGYNVSLSLTDTPTNLVFDNNLYSSVSGNKFRYNSYTPINWEQFRSLYELGFEVNSPEPANPLFVNASGGYTTAEDFRLNSISPVINSGTDVGLTEDFDGNPLVGTPDIGAYEYQGDIVAPTAPGGLAVE